MTVQPRWVSGEELRDRVRPDAARAAVEAALRQGFDPAVDPPRLSVPAGTGHLLVMPSATAGHAGVKIASVAPGNPALGRDRIQAVYVLMDAETLTPSVLVDGSALTALRTPAVSAVAADHLAAPDARRLVVFGAGPQARGHVDALRRVRPIESVVVVGRRRSRTDDLVAAAGAMGLDARAGTPDDVSAADVVVCATSAGTPLFDGSLVADGTCVLAIGSHEPDRRELDGGLLGRAQVVVEDVSAATREAGDVVIAAAEGALDVGHLVPLAALVSGRAGRVADRPNVFKGVGMAWQDLVVASLLVDPVDDAGGVAAESPTVAPARRFADDEEER